MSISYSSRILSMMRARRWRASPASSSWAWIESPNFNAAPLAASARAAAAVFSTKRLLRVLPSACISVWERSAATMASAKSDSAASSSNSRASSLTSAAEVRPLAVIRSFWRASISVMHRCSASWARASLSWQVARSIRSRLICSTTVPRLRSRAASDACVWDSSRLA